MSEESKKAMEDAYKDVNRIIKLMTAVKKLDNQILASSLHQFLASELDTKHEFISTLRKDL